MILGNVLDPNAVSVLAPEDPSTARKLLPWIWILALVFALHSITFLLRMSWTAPETQRRMPIQTVDPRKLEAIRKQWDKQAKQLLLNQDKSKPTEKDAPKDAKFFSDRNIHVDKEQRARDKAIIPKPGSPNAPESGAQRQQQPKAEQAKPEAPKKTAPALGDLGVPLRLNEPAKPKSRPAPERQERAQGQRGGSQAIEDDSIPEGSENLLNAQESVYYSFYARVYESVGPVWGGYAQQAVYSQRLLPGDYVTQVDVVLDRDGNLLRVERIHSSGIPALDAAVDQAWRRIGRFPNPPSTLLDEAGEIHTGWTFTVHLGGNGGGLQLLPPERNY